MEKFNNTSLFTGYLKQLLHDFNLPKYRVYTKQNKEYYLKYKKESKDIIETQADTSKFISENGLTKSYNEHLRYIPYIKDGEIKQYINGKWYNTGKLDDKIGTNIKYYDYNAKILNYTKNLKIVNNVYDSYTHEYLGDYLRFIRDYKNVNLMPLYNCFSNTQCSKLDITGNILNTSYVPLSAIELKQLDSKEKYYGYYVFDTYINDYVLVDDLNINELSINPFISQDALPITVSYTQTQAFKMLISNSYDLDTNKPLKFSFNTQESAYKIYMLPVKLFKKYTIAIDCEDTFEICCGLYGKYQDTRTKFKDLPSLTYKKVCGSIFTKPFIYDKLINLSEYIDKNSSMELAQNEQELKMFIKIPTTNNSTIVVLEGDYIGWNDTISNNDAKTKMNHSVINFENVYDDVPFDLKTRLQLLAFNTKEQHPFSDKLVEYLLGNVIDNNDEIEQNIERAQKVVRLACNQAGFKYKPSVDGLWDDSLKLILYEYMINNNINIDNKEFFGYVDKSTEKLFNYIRKENNKIVKSISIMNADLDTLKEEESIVFRGE